MFSWLFGKSAAAASLADTGLPNTDSALPRPDVGEGRIRQMLLVQEYWHRSSSKSHYSLYDQMAITDYLKQHATSDVLLRVAEMEADAERLQASREFDVTPRRGGLLLNCVKCGHGRMYWILRGDHWYCPYCQGDPIAGDGRDDFSDFNRARMVNRFGSRMDGDAELVEKYRKEMP